MQIKKVIFSKSLLVSTNKRLPRRICVESQFRRAFAASRFTSERAKERTNAVCATRYRVSSWPHSSGRDGARSGMSLFCGNISHNASPRDVESLFMKFGQCRVDVKRGFAFVDFEDDRDAEDAMKELQGQVCFVDVGRQVGTCQG